MTRYIRAGQARQSLLVWKIFGKRLDGRSNADRPTETEPGDPSTIPAGASWENCDLDYNGSQMPPLASGITLTWEERAKIARWVDIGAPIDRSRLVGNGFAGFFEDDLRPTLSLLPTVEQGARAGSIRRFVIGAYDLDSGIDPASLRLTLDRDAGGSPAGTNLAAGLTITEGGTVSITLPGAIDITSGSLSATLQIRDRAGHTTTILRTWRRASQPLPLANVSAASYSGAVLAPESIIAAFGSSLASVTTVAGATPLPTSLSGTSVSVRDSTGVERLSPLFFVSPTQINYLMPAGTANGSATILSTGAGNQLSLGTVTIARVAPALFAADASGQGLPAAALLRIRPDGSQSFEAVARFDSQLNRVVAAPIDFGPANDQVFLILFGAGLRYRSSAANVYVTIGGFENPVLFAGAHGNLIGLDQVNLQLPRTLAGRGEVELRLKADDRLANPLRLHFK